MVCLICTGIQIKYLPIIVQRNATAIDLLSIIFRTEYRLGILNERARKHERMPL